MSQEEQDLIRIRSWDAYCAAKGSYHVHKARLAERGKLLLGVGRTLMESPANASPDQLLALPRPEQLAHEVREFREGIAELKRTLRKASDFGFTVDHDLLHEIGPL